MNDLTSRDSRSYSIMGAAMEVHRQLGCGFLESVYQEALALELTSRDVPYSRETRFPVLYEGHQLASRYRPDFICFGSVVVELKALGQLSSIEESQLLNYLKVTGCQTGLLLNFGRKSLEQRRFVLTQRSGVTA